MRSKIIISLKNLFNSLKFVLKTDIMAQLSDFQAQFDRMNAAISKLATIPNELASLKKIISESGMSAEEQSAALTTLTNIADSLESLAGVVVEPTTQAAPSTDGGTI